MKKGGVTLKKGKEKIFHQRHHWIFSGAIHSYPDSYKAGEILPVFSAEGEELGAAYFNKRSSISGRILSFGKQAVEIAVEQAIKDAIALRNYFFKGNTTAYRLINGEGDRLPGLIVDRYGENLVIQIGTLGMERLKPQLLKLLLAHYPVHGIYEKSTLPTRKEEGLENYEGLLYGEVGDWIEIEEEGHRFLISIREGQKTGFFLDQREMRKWIGTLSVGKKVLNAFCYSGGFTVYALKGGALQVDSVDISKEASELVEKNLQLNGLLGGSSRTYCEDVFSFLKRHPLEEYGIVILDPPAFAKKKGDVINACRGYKEINRLAFQKMRGGSLLLTCSCSYHIDATLFQQVIFQAAQEAGKQVKIIGKHRLGIDHPLNLFHPEGDYLKSLLLYIDSP